jgi:hypothetical protein
VERGFIYAFVSPHPALSKGEGSKKGNGLQVLSFGEDLGEAKLQPKISSLPILIFAYKS